MKKVSFCILSLLLSVLFLASSWMIAKELTAQQKEKDAFDKLAEIITAQPTQPPETAAPPIMGTTPEEMDQPTEPVSSRNIAKLVALNSECVGWIFIPGTAVDYPLMHTPGNPQKYLRRNFYGEYSNSGVPFLDGRCSLDGDNLILYGHNMKNETMFADVCGYADPDFCAEHPEIEVETLDGVKRYAVFAVLKTTTSDAWYDFLTAESRGDFDSQVSDAVSRSLHRSGIRPEFGQQILTLSTCYGSSRNGRLLVLAVHCIWDV